MKKAGDEVEKASLLFQMDTPVTLDSVERASREWEELGRSLNSLGDGINRTNPVRAVQSSTRKSMRRVASDVTNLTKVGLFFRVVHQG